MRKIVLQPRTKLLLRAALGIVIGIALGVPVFSYIGLFGAAPFAVKVVGAVVSAVAAFGFLAQRVAPGGKRFDFGPRQ